jgi:hypothetical protein
MAQTASWNGSGRMRTRCHTGRMFHDPLSGLESTQSPSLPQTIGKSTTLANLPLFASESLVAEYSQTSNFFLVELHLQKPELGREVGRAGTLH